MLGKRLFRYQHAALIRDTPLWRERDELLRSVLAVGKVLSSTLLAHLPELGCSIPRGLAAEPNRELCYPAWEWVVSCVRSLSVR